MQNKFANLHWLFFDVGYTLFDETPAWEDRFVTISSELKRRGRDVPVAAVWQTYRDVCADFEPKQWMAIARRLSTSDEEFKALDALSVGWQHELQTAYPGVGELLRSLHERYKIGIIANQSLGTADRLRERGLMPYIDFVIGSAEAGVQKPDPKIFQMALDQAGCKPAEAAMIGDRIDNDVAPANRIGMKSIHVRQGGGALQNARNPTEIATATVGSIIEINPLLL